MWRKLGRIFEHEAQLPTAWLEGDILRVFYSIRIEGQSHIRQFLYDMASKVGLEVEGNVLSPGERGCFDDAGVMPGSLLNYKEKRYLFYTGWHLKKSVPYSHAVGVADWNNGVWNRMSDGPIVAQSLGVPQMANSPFFTDENGYWCLYFCNGQGWNEDFPYYGISSAISVNKSVLDWKVITHLKPVGIEGAANSRPCVLDNTMLLAHKKKDTPYQIAQFEQIDRDWKLVDDNVIPVSESGWDSEMVCYPWVFNHSGSRYMLYNGNGYGKSGVGLAICED